MWVSPADSSPWWLCKERAPPSRRQEERVKSPIVSREDPRARRARPLVRVVPGTLIRGEVAAQIRQLALLDEELQRRLEQAREEGREQGMADLVRSCASLLQRANDEADRLVVGATEEVIRLALAVATRVVHALVEADPVRIKHIVDEVRDHHYSLRTPLTLFAGARAHEALLRLGIEDDHILTLHGDPDAEAWALRFESPDSVLHAGIEHQLSVVSRAMLRPKTGQP